MKYYFASFVFLILFSCSKSSEIETHTYLNKQEIEDFKYSVSRYVGKLAKKATHETKFEKRFDREYQNQSQNMELIFYYINPKTEEHFFAISKIAPSLKIKKTATVGKLKKDSQGAIIYYEEIFRTWKMEEPELLEKTKLLFMKSIKGEDLTKYYTQNSQPEFYIEFPDEFTYFDKQKRKWVIQNDLSNE